MTLAHQNLVHAAIILGLLLAGLGGWLAFYALGGWMLVCAVAAVGIATAIRVAWWICAYGKRPYVDPPRARALRR
jgi:hypothetical protein